MKDRKRRKVSVKPSVPVSNNILHLKSLQQVTIRVRFFMFDHRGKQIYLICGSTDMSKGIDGLSSIVDRKRQTVPVVCMDYFCEVSQSSLHA